MCYHGHVDVISASIGEDVCCYYMPPCNLKRLHYQFPQCKLDRVVNAFSLQLLIISGVMGGWIRGQDKSSLSSTFHKITEMFFKTLPEAQRTQGIEFKT